MDAVHFAPHERIDVQAWDCDFLGCSAYKFFGPHLGILYGKHRHLAHFTPYKVEPAKNVAPYKWETGTQSWEALAGVEATVEYLASLSGLDGAEHELEARSIWRLPAARPMNANSASICWPNWLSGPGSPCTAFTVARGAPRPSP